MQNLAVAAFLLASVPLAAQRPVCVTGRVARVPGPTICMQGETHLLESARVFLRSGAVNLDQFVGRVVEVQGAEIGLLCNVIDVQVVVPARALVTHCGSSMLGCPLKVQVQGAGLGYAILAASTVQGFQPFGCGFGSPGVRGTLLLDQPIATLVAGMTGTGELEHVLTVPLDPGLMGLRVFFQGAHMTVGPIGPMEIGNVVDVIVVPLMPPCVPANC